MKRFVFRNFLLRDSLSLHISHKPVIQLLFKTAIQQWRTVLANISSSILDSLTEGATLGLVFLAVEVLSSASDPIASLKKIPLLSHFGLFTNSLSNIPTSSLFLLLLSLALFVQAIQAACRFTNSVSLAYLNARTRTLVTSQIHSQILSFTFPFSSSFKIGDLVDYATTGPDAIRIQLEQISNLLIIIPSCLVYVAILLFISPWMLVAVLLIGTLIYSLQKTMIPRIMKGSQHVSNEQVRVNERMTEDFQGLRLLHSSGQLEQANMTLSSKLEGLELQLKKQAPRIAILSPISSFLPILAITLIAASSIFLLGNKSGGVLPSLATFVLALQRLTIRITMIGSITNTLADNSGRLKRLSNILSSENKSFRRKGGFPFDSLKYSVVFSNVSLRYKDSELYALKNIYLELKKGTTTALVGPSGAGKSSISDLLTGIYNPTSGAVLIDNIPFADYEISSWQSRLGVVSQDTFLFNDTIASNIAFGATGVSHQSVINACKLAQADQFIDMLPDGYSTLIGERGYRLSGGQRQRLSLARALIRNPELLILDEATSALDSQNEMLVQHAIQSLSSSFTILIIAHRLSTVINSDNIIVLQNGIIVQSGSHPQLATSPGLYQDLWSLQSKSAK